MADEKGPDHDCPVHAEIAQVEDSESDEEDVYDDELLRKIRTLKQKLEEDPYLYDSHLELISSLRQTGDLDLVRKAREKMHDLFPLTEELWLQWLRDELMLTGIDEALKDIRALFEKAVKDYMAPGVWLLYCQFAVDHMDRFEEGVDFPKDVFDRAVKACGLHVTKGSLIWDAYREFEMAIHSALQEQLTQCVKNDEADDDEAEEKEELKAKIQEQYFKVDWVFQRQLSVPLLGMESTLEEYREWDSEEDITEDTLPCYSSALEKLKEITPYEESLTSTQPLSIEAFKEYISYEKKGKNLPRVICLYQRALSHHPLDVGLWMEYTKYVDVSSKMADVVIPTHIQSIRNCPWSVNLWLSYLRAVERHNFHHEDIVAIFEKSLGGNFVNTRDYLRVWMAYLVYLRSRVREVDWEFEVSRDSSKGTEPEEREQDSTTSVGELKGVLKRALDYQKENFGDDADPDGLITRFQAQIEGCYLGNMELARELWEGLIYWHSSEVEYWMQYAQLEWHLGNKDKCRSVFKRAVNSVQDYPELLFENFLFFERMEGTLDTLMSAEDRVRERRILIKRKEKKYLQREQDRETKKQFERGRRPRSGEDKEKKRGPEKKRSPEKKRKRQYKDFVEESNSEGVAMETNKSPSDSLPKKPKYKSTEDSEVTPTDNRQEKPHVETSPSASVQSSSDTSTVFVSNLPLATKSSELQSLFEECGPIDDVRIVKSRKELAKKPFGYAYVQFRSKESVPKALLMDRTTFFGRQIYISPYDGKRKERAPMDVQRFPSTKDKKTVFVSNLPFSLTEDDIRELFCEFGSVKQVRLPFKRQRRGIAYVEYEEETAAEEAVKQLNQSDVRGRMITVAISDPPKKDKGAEVAMETTLSEKPSGGTSSVLMPPPRMIPTSVATIRRQKLQLKPSIENQKVEDSVPKQTPPTSVSEEGDRKTGAMKSNEDFRKMFGV